MLRPCFGFQDMCLLTTRQCLFIRRKNKKPSQAEPQTLQHLMHTPRTLLIPDESEHKLRRLDSSSLTKTTGVAQSLQHQMIVGDMGSDQPATHWQTTARHQTKKLDGTALRSTDSHTGCITPSSLSLTSSSIRWRQTLRELGPK